MLVQILSYLFSYQNYRFESCEWRKSVMEEFYILLGQQELNSSEIENPKPTEKKSVKYILNNINQGPGG